MLLREIRIVNLLPKAQISISGANFLAVETEADFFNRIGPKAVTEMSDRIGWLAWYTLIETSRRDYSKAGDVCPSQLSLRGYPSGCLTMKWNRHGQQHDVHQTSD